MATINNNNNITASTETVFSFDSLSGKMRTNLVHAFLTSFQYKHLKDQKKYNNVINIRGDILLQIRNSLLPIYKQMATFYLPNDEVPWSTIDFDETQLLLEFKQVAERIYSNNFVESAVDPMRSYVYQACRASHMYLEYLIDPLSSRLHNANVRMYSNKLNLRVSRPFPIDKFMFLVLCSSTETNVVTQVNHILLSLIDQIHTTRVNSHHVYSIFVRSLMRVLFKNTSVNICRPEGLLDAFNTASSIPEETKALIKDVSSSAQSFEVTNKLLRDKVLELTDFIKSTVSDIKQTTGSFFTPIAPYSTRDSDKDFSVVKLMFEYFIAIRDVVAQISSMDAPAILELFLNTFSKGIYAIFDSIVSAPLHMRIAMLAVSTYISVKVSESSTSSFSDAFWKMVVALIATFTLVATVCSFNASAFIAKIVKFIFENRGIALSLTAVVAFALKEYLGITNVEVLKSAVHIMTLVPRCSSGFASCVAIVGALWNKVIYSLIDKNPELEQNVYYSTSDEIYRSTHVHVEALRDLLMRGSVVHGDTLVHVETHLAKLEKLLAKKMPRDLSSYMVVIQGILNKAKQYVANARRFGIDVTGPRQEPLCVFICGAPGVFKSQFATYMNDVIQKHILGRELEYSELIKNTFSINVHSDYWEGYENHLVCMMDDFMQMREQVGDASSSSKIIEMINTMPTPLNMANLDAKGTVYFTSKAVILTSNMRKIASEAIISNEALARRMHFYLEISVKPEFQKKDVESGLLSGRADPKTLPRGPKGESLIPSDIWNIVMYQACDQHGNPVNPVSVEWSDLVRLVKEQYDFRVRIHESMQANLDQFRASVRDYNNVDYDAVDSEYFTSAKSDAEDHCDFSDFSDMSMLPVSMDAIRIYFSSYPGGVEGYWHFLESKGIDVLHTRTLLVTSLRAWHKLFCDLAHAHQSDRAHSVAFNQFCSLLTEPEYVLSFSELVLETNILRKRLPLPSNKYEISLLDCISEVDYGIDRAVTAYRRRHVSDAVIQVRSAGDYIKYFGVSMLVITGLFYVAKWFVPDTVSGFLFKFHRLISSPTSYFKGDAIVDGDESLEFVPESSIKGKNRLVKPKTQKIRARIVNSATEGDLILNTAGRMQMEIMNKVTSNLCTLVLASQSAGPLKIVGNALFLRDDLVMFNKHYLDVIDILTKSENGLCSSYNDLVLYFTKACDIRDFDEDDDQELFLSYVLGNRGYALDIFVEGATSWASTTGGYDLILLPVGQGHQMKNVISKFVTEKQVAALPSAFEVTMHGRNKGKELVVNLTATKITNSPVQNYEDRPSIRIARGIQYNYSMGPGSCGSPIFLTSERSTCILGIHSAGSADSRLCSLGKSIIITREEIDTFVAALDFRPEGDIASFPFPSEKHGLKCPSSVNVSNIVPTTLQGLLGPVTKRPARLRQFIHPEEGVINPLMKAYAGYGKGTFAPDARCLNLAVKELTADLLFNLPSFTTEPLDLEDSVRSIVLDGRTVTGIARGTSVGYPYNTYLCKNKKALWGEGGDYTFDSKEWLALLVDIKAKEEGLIRGERQVFYFQDCLKDETVSLAKADAGKTRLFAASSVDYLVLFRKYFLGCINAFEPSQFATPVMVGLNPMSNQWEAFANYLSSYNDSTTCSFLDGDFAGFDKSQKKEIFLIIYDIIEDLYKKNTKQQQSEYELCARVRRLLWTEVYASVHICADYRVYWDGALPSGHPMTTIINSLYNTLSFYYCWTRVVAESQGDIRETAFARNISLGVYGDDVIFGASESAKKIFTFDVIRKHMAELGLDFTPAVKTKTTDDYKSLSHCTFLKRGFRREPLLQNVYVAPLDIQSIVNSMYWRKKSHPEREHFKMVGEVFINEMAFHGDETYNHYVPLLIKYLREFGVIRQRIETDRRLRMEYVFYSFDNLYEYTDKFVDRYLELKSGARIFDQEDIFMIESCVPCIPEADFEKSLFSFKGVENRISQDLMLKLAMHETCSDEEKSEYVHYICSSVRLVHDYALEACPIVNRYYDVDVLTVNDIYFVIRSLINSSHEIRATLHITLKNMVTNNNGSSFINDVNHTSTAELSRRLYTGNDTFKVEIESRCDEFVVTTVHVGDINDTIVCYPEADVVDVTATTVTQTTPDDPTESQQGPTASFVSADSRQLTDYVHEPISQDFASSQVTGVDQTLVDFFAKPVLHSTGAFAVTDSPTTFFPIIYLPYDAQSVAMWRNKFIGFMSMKFDLVIRLQVNATRFQQGRYIVYFVPYCGDTINTPTAGNALSTAELWHMMHSANTHCITQLPHAELDIATQSEVVLRIPYINADPYTPMLQTPDALGSWGRVSIFPYSPLQAVLGSTDASYSLWYSLENVELYTPTIPQGDIETREKKENGPITQGLKLASKASKVLGRIPILSSIAGPTSFFFDVASDVARVFGWSRPIDNAKVERRLLTSAPYACNMDSPVFGMPLTNYTDTSVGNLPGFAGSPVDEMAFAAIVSRYSYYARYTWSTSALSGFNIAHFLINPSFYYRNKTMPAPLLTYRQHTPASFVAGLFRFWRGSMKFRVKLVKTEFHSGRLLVTYVPFDYRLSPPTTTALNADMQQYASKTIYDISSMTEFEIILPFASNAPWADNTQPIGFLDFFVLDALKAPNTVASDVTLLVEVAMCADAQFNEYHSENLRTVYCPVTRVEGASVEEGVVNTQCIGGSGSVDVSHLASQYCMGDSIMSFRSLMKRPGYILMTDAARTTLTGTVSQTAGFQTFCAPYRAAAAFNVSVSGVDKLAFPSTGANDLYSLLSCIFALSRGSMCCEIHVPPNTILANTIILRKLKNTTVGSGVSNPLLRAAASTGNTGGLSYEGTNGMRGGCSPLIAYNVANQAHFQVKLDCYNRCYTRPNASLISCDNLDLTISPDEMGSGSYAPAVVVAASTSASQLYSWSRFAADDFSMGYFICIPPVLADLTDIAIDGSY